MTTLENSIKTGFITFVYHTSANMAITLEVIKETEKAVQFKNDHNNKTVWMPKTGIEFCDKYRVFTLKSWLKMSISKENDYYKLSALGI